MEILLILTLALAADLIFGEMPNLVHPVVWMGKLAAVLERFGLRGAAAFQFVYGLLMTLFLAALFGAATYFLLTYLENLSVVAYGAVGVLLLKASFSLGELRKAALRVKHSLLQGNLPAARYELRSLVSRDTQNLSEKGIISAAVESVAENICDSFVAPLFYFLLFGIPGAIVYRVVNTLDAMIGYHGKYEYLGKFAARVDDALNYIPARLSAALLIKSSFLTGLDFKVAWRRALSEHSKTESPNAGWTMSAAAGALGVRLEKEGHYRLGEPVVALTPETITAALKLVWMACLIWVIFCFVAGGLYFVFTS